MARSGQYVSGRQGGRGSSSSSSARRSRGGGDGMQGSGGSELGARGDGRSGREGFLPWNEAEATGTSRSSMVMRRTGMAWRRRAFDGDGAYEARGGSRAASPDEARDDGWIWAKGHQGRMDLADRARRGRKHEAVQNLAPATMAAGANPVRFLAEEKNK